MLPTPSCGCSDSTSLALVISLRVLAASSAVWALTLAASTVMALRVAAICALKFVLVDLPWAVFCFSCPRARCRLSNLGASGCGIHVCPSASGLPFTQWPSISRYRFIALQRTWASAL